MPRTDTAKIRLIAVYRILMRGEKVTSPQILQELENVYGIRTTFNSVQSDIRAIDRFVPIEVTTGYNGGYQMMNVLEGCEDDST